MANILTKEQFIARCSVSRVKFVTEEKPMVVLPHGIDRGEHFDKLMSEQYKIYLNHVTK